VVGALKYICMVYGILVLWLVLSAFTIRPTGGDFVVAYTEPSLNADSTPLTDLDHCNVYMLADSQAVVESSNIAASGPTGGAQQLPVVTLTWGPVPSQALPLDFSVTCTDAVGNESAVGSHVLFAVDPYPLLVP